jgi:hypothetical protein
LPTMSRREPQVDVGHCSGLCIAASKGKAPASPAGLYKHARLGD